MNKSFYLLAIVAVLAVSPVKAQVPPDAIDASLLKESQKAVLGSESEIDWKRIPVNPSQKEKLKGKLKMKSQVPDTLHIGSVESEGKLYWIIPDIAPSKSEKFSYLLFLNADKEIEDVDVLEYRENYGYEIDYSFFRKQFRGKDKAEEIRFGRTIQNISGATISARSLTYSVSDLMNIVQVMELK